MSASAAEYDFIANYFRSTGRASMPIEEAVAEARKNGHDRIWQTDKRIFYAAMRSRDVFVRNDMLERPYSPDDFRPVSIGYDKFLDEAAALVRVARHPLDAAELLAVVSQHTNSPVPSGDDMQNMLRHRGVHYIPGTGYWHARIYTTPQGHIVTADASSFATDIARCFETMGWPIVGQDVERETKGRVTSKKLAAFCHSRANHLIAGVGSGLYVPADTPSTLTPLPMTRNVAKALLAIEPSSLITDKHDLRLFRLCLVLARQDLATIKKSRTLRGGVKAQTVRLELTDRGRSMLSAKARATPDEF